MGDIIKFPSWLAEKERELEELEMQLEFERHIVQQERQKIKNVKILYATRMMMAFCLGIIIMAAILIPAMS
tara:strand:+ start:575 stop:787 length:213 start_codon:yes stop_codon:yes gene_type:complete